MIKTVLFDLDGTLLPQDAEVFTKSYFKALSEWMAPHGYEFKSLVGGVMKGMDAMVANDGSMSNSDAFWQAFSRLFGNNVYDDISKFDAFYVGDGFGALEKYTRKNPLVAKTIEHVKSLGARLGVATNPVFPMTAQKRRIGWTGANVDDFALVTAYEDSHYCKPNTAYYKEILDKLGASAGECLMIGNDVQEDMCAREIGINVFLLTDCLIDRKNTDTTVYPQGDFAALNKYIDSLS